MPQNVGCPRSAVAVEAEIFFIEDGLETLALPVGKDEVGGSGGTPLFANDSLGLGPFRGRVHAVHARRAEPAFKSRASASIAIRATCFSGSILQQVTCSYVGLVMALPDRRCLRQRKKMPAPSMTAPAPSSHHVTRDIRATIPEAATASKPLVP
jgi:hypothetical protein